MFWCVKQKDYLCIRKTESNNSIINNRKLFASEAKCACSSVGRASDS